MMFNKIISKRISKEYRFAIVYYIAMLAILLSWTDFNSAPSPLLRYLYIAAMFVPLVFKYSELSPSIIVLFVSIGIYGYAFSYLPFNLNIYSLFLIFVVFANRGKRIKDKFIGINNVYLFCIIFLIVDLITSFRLHENFSCVVVFICLSYSLSRDVNQDYNILRLSFILMSFILSLEFLRWGGSMATDYYVGNQLEERFGWRIDPNYLGGILGMGGLLAFISLLNNKNEHLVVKIFYGATCFVVLVALGINASRGAILAFAVACAMNILVHRTNLIYKMLFVGSVILMVYWCYASSYFDLLLYRIGNDESGGSGRLEIWSNKLMGFFNEGNIINWFFGFGFDGGMKLGVSSDTGCHNDFIAALVEYGFVGFATLCSLFVSLFKSLQGAKAEVMSLILYLVLMCMTLEPLTQGWITYWLFIFYIMIRIRSLRKSEQ